MQKEAKKKKSYDEFVFGGNIGLGQDIKKVCNFFNKLKVLSQNFKFNIIGSGLTKNLINSNLENPVLKKIKILNSLPIRCL